MVNRLLVHNNQPQKQGIWARRKSRAAKLKLVIGSRTEKGFFDSNSCFSTPIAKTAQISKNWFFSSHTWNLHFLQVDFIDQFSWDIRVLSFNPRRLLSICTMTFSICNQHSMVVRFRLCGLQVIAVLPLEGPRLVPWSRERRQKGRGQGKWNSPDPSKLRFQNQVKAMILAIDAS